MRCKKANQNLSVPGCNVKQGTQVSPSVVITASRSPDPFLHLPPWHFLPPFSRAMLGHFCLCSLPMTQHPLIQAVLLTPVTQLFDRFTANSFEPQPLNRAGTGYIGLAALSCKAKPFRLTAGWHCWVRQSPGCSGAASSIHRSVPPKSARVSSAVWRVQEGTVEHLAHLTIPGNGVLSTWKAADWWQSGLPSTLLHLLVEELENLTHICPKP